MLFNDGSQYRVVTDPARHMAEREVFMFRAMSARTQSTGGAPVPYVDTAFERHREQLADMRGLVIYQYAHAVLDPEESAENFLNALNGLRWNEMVMIDPETGGGFTPQNVADWVGRWLTVVEAELYTKAWLYVPRALNPGLALLPGDRIRMCPKYSRTPHQGMPPDWPWDVHQFTDQGHFPGCPDPAGGDLSFTTLTAEDMLRRCNPHGIICDCTEGATRDVTA